MSSARVVISLTLALILLGLVIPYKLYAQQRQFLPKVLETQPKTNKVISSVILPPSIRVTSPNGGETILLDGEIYPITFSTSSFDPAKDGEYKFQLELWRLGEKVGNINPSPQVFSLKNIETGFGLPQYQAGAYYVGGGAPVNYFVATPGPGYRVKVVAYLNEKVFTTDESDSPFTFTAGPARGYPHVTLIKPNGGEMFVLGKGGAVGFSYGNLDPYKQSLYNYGFELLRGGKRLGELIGRNSLSPKNDKMAVSINIDSYQNPETLKVVKAESGSGYKLRVVIYESGKAVVSDDSDASFSFTEESQTPFNSILTFSQSLLGKFKKLFSR